jgi:hypothetical protein
MSLPLPSRPGVAQPAPEAPGRPVVYLHVGAPKTGTTYLQSVLWKNEDALQEQGYALPLGSFNGQYLATMDARGVAQNAAHLQHARGSWQRLVDEVRAWSGGSSIVSHELLAGADAEHARAAVAALSPAEVHVVYTARDLARQIPAEWQEHVKHRSTIGITQFVRAVVNRGPAANWFWQVQDPVGVLGRWGADLPPEQVHLVTVPPKGADPGLLWSRFAATLRLDPTSFDLDIERSNESLGAAQAEVLRRVNLALGERLPFPGPYPRFGKELLAQKILANQRNAAAFSLRPRLRPWLEERSQETIDAIKAAGYDVVGDLDDLRPAETTRTVLPDEVPDADLSAAAIQALADLLVIHHRALNANRQRPQPV